jgi:copper chaperone CopZ
MPSLTQQSLLLISGMRNNGCRGIVTRVLREVQGVREAHVNLYRASALVIHEPWCSTSELIVAVILAGYGAVAFDGSSGQIELLVHPRADDPADSMPSQGTLASVADPPAALAQARSKAGS